MTTLNLQVGASTDDADQTTTDLADLTSTTLQVFCGTTPQGIIGTRFTGVTIDGGTTITSAVWQVYCASSDDLKGAITADDDDNAPTFSASSPNRLLVGDRPRTTASVTWDAANIGTGAFKDSPDIATVLQEIVDRAGWANGNAIAIMFDAATSGAFRIFAPTSYDGSTSNCPKLSITYGGAALLPRMSLMGVG